MKTVVITGADRNIGLEIAREYAKRDWKVFAGRYLLEWTLLDDLKKEYPKLIEIINIDVSSDESMIKVAKEVLLHTNKIDAIVHNAAHFGLLTGEDTLKIGDEQGRYSFDEYMAPYNINALGAIRLFKAFENLLKEGDKRLCFVSSEAGSISVSHRNEVSSYGMSKTALNMIIRLMHNQLNPIGYTFRLFHPGWVRSPKEQGAVVLGGKFEPWESAQAAVPFFINNNNWENRIQIIDNENAAWPF